MRRVAVFAVVGLLWGCGSTRYVPVESVRTEWRDRVVWRVDSVGARESEAVTERLTERLTVTVNEAGDTLRTDREAAFLRDGRLERENVVVRAAVDSLRGSAVVAVAVPVPVVEGLTWWDRVKIEAGGVAIGCLGAVVVGGIWYVLRRFC